MTDIEGTAYRIVLKNPAPAEEPAEETVYEYTFSDIGDTALLSYILGVNEIYATIDSYEADPEAVAVSEEDLYVTALIYFDETVLTVTDIDGIEYRIILKNPVHEEPAEPTEIPAEAVTLGEADVSEAAAILGIEETVTEKPVKTRGASDFTIYTKTGFFGLDISVDPESIPGEGEFIVPVVLPS